MQQRIMMSKTKPHNKKIKLAAVILTMFLCDKSHAAEHDFYLDINQCKIIAGYLTQSKDNLQIHDGNTSIYACRKNKTNTTCDIFFKNEEQSKKVINLNIVANTPPLLIFMSDYGNDFISINTEQHAVTIATRMMNNDYLAEKVCSGFYATDREMNMDTKKQWP